MLFLSTWTTIAIISKPKSSPGLRYIGLPDYDRCY